MCLSVWLRAVPVGMHCVMSPCLSQRIGSVGSQTPLQLQATVLYWQLHLTLVFYQLLSLKLFFINYISQFGLMCGRLALWIISRASARLFPSKNYLGFAENSHWFTSWVVELRYILGRSYLIGFNFNMKPWKL